MKIGNIELFSKPDFCALYFPPGLTCGVWLGLVRDGTVREWEQGRLHAIEVIYPFSFHIQNKGVAIVPTFPVLDRQKILFVQPFAVDRLGTVTEEHDQLICDGDYIPLFSTYLEMILTSVAEKSNLVLAGPGDLSRLSSSRK